MGRGSREQAPSSVAGMKRTSPNWPNKRYIPEIVDMKTYSRSVHPSTLNANQFLVHSDLLDDEFGGDNSSPDEPIRVSPAAGGRWDVWDGHHRALRALQADRRVRIEWDGGSGANPHRDQPTALLDNPMRLTDMKVVHPGEEGEYIDVDDLVAAERVSPHLMTDGEIDIPPVWHV